MVLKFDMRTAYTSGEKEHPQLVMKQLGYKPTKAQPESMGDCWFFEVPEIKEPLPSYLTVSSTYQF